MIDYADARQWLKDNFGHDFCTERFVMPQNAAGAEGGKRMSRYGKAGILAIAAAVLFYVLFFALVVCLGWAEATAETQQTFDLAELK